MENQNRIEKIQKEQSEKCSKDMQNCSEEVVSGTRYEDEIEAFKKLYPNLCENFSTVELEQLILFARKCTDYGIKNISVGTDLNTKEEIQFALGGIWFRMQDKMNRWKNIMTRGDIKVSNETLLDTFQDLANYAMIANMVISGRWYE